jgi:hypothetical protein
MEQPEKILSYRIVKVAIDNFNMQPQPFNNEENLGMQTSYSFQVNYDIRCIRCLSSFIFTKGEIELLNLSLSCVFNIEPSAFESMYDERKEHFKIDAYFCRYMATIAVGAARGVIAAKTEQTELSAIVLPPINLVEAIKKDAIFTV